MLVFAVALTGCGDKESQVETTVSEVSAQLNNSAEVLSTSFRFPDLERERTVRLYLPPGYSQSSKRYPVLYMHDGQNLFDEATAYAGEWQVDESLNELAKTGLELIVVGIDNGGESRMQEYSPWYNAQFGEAEGEEYMALVVDVIKPYIDKHYRTMPDRESTAIMGSSMGGLISHYGLWQYSDVFSKAGIFSPSYWYSEDVFSFTSETPLPADSRVYWIVGQDEGPDMVNGMSRMVEHVTALEHPSENRFDKVVEGQGHNEAFWASEFSDAVSWLFNAPSK